MLFLLFNYVRSREYYKYLFKNESLLMYLIAKISLEFPPHTKYFRSINKMTIFILAVYNQDSLYPK